MTHRGAATRGSSGLAASLVGCLLALAVFPAASLAIGASIEVDTTDDESMSNGICSLREAVKSANTNSNAHEPGCEMGLVGPNTDFIELDAGIYTLTGASGDNANVSGDLDITGGGPVIINGAPINTSDKPVSVINGAYNDRLFDLILNGGEQVDVELLALELRNGKVTGSDDGGAVQVLDPDARLYIDTVIATGNDAGDYGGAIYFPDGNATARFTIEQSEFTGNTAGDEGGALWLDMIENAPNDPTISHSAFIGNSAAQMGGAIYLGTRTLNAIFLRTDNTTISGNSAGLGGGALAFDLAETGNASFQFSTIANNTTPIAGQGGGILTATVMGGPDDQFVQLNTSIIAGNTAAGAPSNCAGPGNFQGGNSVESTNSCGLSLGTSLVNTDPKIAPLATYPGGELTTRTHGLYDSSPAVNKLAPVSGMCAGLTDDQRFVTRPAGGGCDVGAHEGTVGPAPAGPATQVTPTTPAKKCKKKKKKKKRSAAAAKKKKGCKKKKKKK